MVEPFLFPEPLVEGVIEWRRSQFTMQVAVGGESASCHCPTTNRIGDIELKGRPCLLSRAADPKRKTPYTVEAVSLDRPGDAPKSWIGINQNAANRYVEHYLANGGFSEMVGHAANERAILLTCFIYDNPGFEVLHRSEHYEQTKAALDAARAAGVETWQANFELTPEGVELRKCFPIEV